LRCDLRVEHCSLDFQKALRCYRVKSWSFYQS
ncbi:hypothetical protein TSPI_01635, partial [Trichinella spiralis]